MFSLTNAEVGLTLWTVVFGFPPQYAAAAISCVPTKVARESWSVTRLEKHSFNSLKVNVSLHLTQRALYVMVVYYRVQSIIQSTYLGTVTKLTLLRGFRRLVIGSCLLWAEVSVMGDVCPPKARARGVCSRP